MDKKQFQSLVYQFYRDNRRTFAWREHITPYRVVVSEIMLQQTQTFRVADKFDVFVRVFSDFQALAQAPWPIVLGLWKGLGYNRRARYLQEVARLVVADHAGVLPPDPTILEQMPGIGPATARSIATFTYNQPEIFIETNIRAVFIHHFFAQCTDVDDREIIPLVTQMLDGDNPREWYYALMDYGVMLKKQFKNPARRSAHHQKQSRFKGSFRQLRGKILQLLLSHAQLPAHELYDMVNYRPDEVDRALAELCVQNLIQKSEDVYHL